MVSGMGKSLLVFTPAGAYIGCPLGAGSWPVDINPGGRLVYMSPLFEGFDCRKPGANPDRLIGREQGDGPQNCRCNEDPRTWPIIRSRRCRSGTAASG